MSKSNYLENKILEHVLSVTSMSMPANVYLGLLSAVNTANDTYTEIPASGNYSATDLNGAVTSGDRPEITFGTASNGQIQGPVNDIEFDNNSGGQFTVAGFAIYDSANSTGNNEVLYYGALSSPKTIDNLDSIRFEASSSITISEE